MLALGLWSQTTLSLQQQLMMYQLLCRNFLPNSVKESDLVFRTFLGLEGKLQSEICRTVTLFKRDRHA